MTSDLQWLVGMVVIPLVGVLLTIDAIIHRDTQRKAREHAQQTAEISEKLQAVEKEFYDYRLSAMSTFASMTSIIDLKKDMKDFFDRVETKIDKMADRLDKKVV